LFFLCIQLFMTLLSTQPSSQAGSFSGIPPGGAYADEAWRFTPHELLQLQELARLRAVGMARAEEIGVFMNGGQPQVVADALLGRNGIIQAFARVARAVRQIIVLEREIAGLCKGPDRDAECAKREQAAAAATAAQGDRPQPLVWSERSDYDNRPLDQVVASVRKVLGADAPEDDPFAPPAQRKARAEAAAEEPTEDKVQADAPDVSETASAKTGNAGVATSAGVSMPDMGEIGLANLSIDEDDDARSRGPPH
jgi:hypothetical protein